jgi:succinate dehydrogenase flavin-adding protein (antitoxin of CptAB toxin-antitoxin module)
MDEMELQMRRMRYRLNRQGMLELDAWLAPLLRADFTNPDTAASIQSLLTCEAPDLQRMMHGDLPLPNGLEGWLKCV